VRKSGRATCVRERRRSGRRRAMANSIRTLGRRLDVKIDHADAA
jgi:hypothetical protein